MKRYFSLYTSVSLAVMLVAVVESTVAREIAYRERDSGTFIINTLDVNQDGFMSATAKYKGFTTLGRVTGQGVSEFSPVERTSCPEGSSEFELVKGSTNGVRRFAKGDLLFTQQTEAKFCIDFLTGDFSAISHADYVGGTGRFSNSSGSNTLMITGKTLVNQGFSSFNAEIRGTLILPDAGARGLWHADDDWVAPDDELDIHDNFSD